jgi:hypothetical protein
MSTGIWFLLKNITLKEDIAVRINADTVPGNMAGRTK